MEIRFWRRHTKLPQVPQASPSERLVRELLRENLSVLPVDMFYREDPLLSMDPSERAIYLKKFFDLFKDPFLMDRIKYHINQQAIKTIHESGSGIQDVAGAMNINGMAFIKDDIEKLANQHIKESTRPSTEFNKFDIIPSVENIP